MRVTAEEARQRARELPPAALGAVAVVAVLVAVLLIRRRRRSAHL
ncbi:MAG TPA: hypothetical protein VFU98_17050 [Microlunatus sp.]|nr:hypothetical protein [Microlunatus sp.]